MCRLQGARLQHLNNADELGRMSCLVSMAGLQGAVIACILHDWSSKRQSQVVRSVHKYAVMDPCAVETICTPPYGNTGITGKLAQMQRQRCSFTFMMAMCMVIMNMDCARVQAG